MHSLFSPLILSVSMVVFSQLTVLYAGFNPFASRIHWLWDFPNTALANIMPDVLPINLGRQTQSFPYNALILLTFSCTLTILEYQVPVVALSHLQ